MVTLSLHKIWKTLDAIMLLALTHIPLSFLISAFIQKTFIDGSDSKYSLTSGAYISAMVLYSFYIPSLLRAIYIYKQYWKRDIIIRGSKLYVAPYLTYGGVSKVFLRRAKALIQDAKSKRYIRIDIHNIKSIHHVVGEKVKLPIGFGTRPNPLVVFAGKQSTLLDSDFFFLSGNIALKEAKTINPKIEYSALEINKPPIAGFLILSGMCSVPLLFD